MMNTITPAVKVYSYRRFSSGRQSSGHSLERQTESARRWCQERGHQLDESLALADLGVSAYSGDNASRGALSGFLQAAQIGRIPKGSILLVESLDRLSRAAIPEAVGLLTSIVRAGIRVVSLIDGHEWNEKTIEDSMSFLLSVMLFSRAHEESSTKARRVSEQFQKKRRSGLAVVSHGHGPGWAFPKADRSGWELDTAKAEVVAKVFELAAAGQGGIAIARIANQEGWPLPWRVRKNTSTRWEHTGVSRLLRDRRTLGEWQPKRMVAGRLTDDGEPVAEYFPRVITDELWFRVQTVLSGRGGPLRIRGVTADVFAGLFYCQCGERMERKAPADRGYARYYCLGRKNGASSCVGVPEKVLLGPVLSSIAQFNQATFNPDETVEATRTHLASCETKLASIEARTERMLDSLEESGHSPLILGRLKSLEDERTAVQAEIAKAKATLKAAPLLGGDFGERLATKAVEVVADKGNSAGRQKIAQALAQAVFRIEWHRPRFIVHLRRGAALFVSPPSVWFERAKNRNAGKPRAAASSK
jgi:DNA invertase Pin-like site-specific DNA recombinase